MVKHQYRVVLKSLSAAGEVIVLAQGLTTAEGAEQARRNWRKALGGKNWTVNRRPGLDTLDYLGLTIERHVVETE